MTRTALTCLVGLAAMLAGCGDDEDEAMAPAEPAEPVVEQPIPEFGYRGSEGPSNWARLDPEWALCSKGDRQSPIDLRGAEKATIAPIGIEFQPSGARVANTGHAVEVALDDAGAAGVHGRSYDLDQFHFHAPSEHRFDGRRLPAEMHLVHTSGDRPPVVIGVPVTEGAENPALQEALTGLPSEPAGERRLDSEIDPSELLPGGGEGEVYRYDGSLTTPPCTEGVLWTVYEQPIELSSEQLDALTAVYSGNARPVQPLGDRRLTRGPLG